MAQNGQNPGGDGFTLGQASGSAANRPDLFNECFCTIPSTPGLAGAGKSDERTKQESARTIFQHPLPQSNSVVLSQVFTRSVNGANMRDLMTEHIVQHLPELQKFTYLKESTGAAGHQATGSGVGLFNHAPYPSAETTLNLPQHNLVAVGEAGVECNMMQQVWSTMSDQERARLDQELDAKLKSARANHGTVDGSAPAPGSALETFDTRVISMVRDYLRQR
jgi:hypothetical protein